MADKIHYVGDAGIHHGVAQKLYSFHCPGCGGGHAFHVPRWSWNGSFDKPSFTPSLVCNPGAPEIQCHSWVTDGRIQFMDDCYHELKGQTVDLPDWEE